ncbi:MAG: UvrD-helicase domain-containing protein [Clostridia bacterium]|nr:UvrD-helicase domain-containing protein [Clostridia bacterium]
MIELTKSQREAVEARGCDILVSAAAGSGKTSTLTERIKKRIITDGAELSRLPVVTFSRASAEDVRLKITKSLETEASLGGRRAARAAALVGSAKIGTIHSFCYSLVKRYYGELGLPPKLRVAEDSEAALMRRRAMEETLDEAAGEETQESGSAGFEFLSDQLAGGGDDGVMVDTLLELYEKTECSPKGFYVISGAARELSSAGGFYASSASGPILKLLREDAEYYAAVFEAAADYFSALGEKSAKNADTFSQLSKTAGALAECFAEADMTRAAEIISRRLPAVGAKGTEGDSKAEFYIAEKRKFSEFLRRTGKKYLSDDEQTSALSLKITAEVSLQIVAILEKFEARYREEKLRRGLCDFADLERYAYRLLSNPELASSVASEIDEIFIDEYQDVNEIQDAIFSLLSSAREECTRFMVGDVKQSIYGFRGADPTIFDAYRRKFSDGASGRLIFMSENFRCDRGVVEFANRVAGRLLPFGNVSCTEEDMLRHAKKEDGTPSGNVKFIIARRGEEMATAEADAAAREIARLIKDGRPPSDIAILMRSAKERAPVFESALRKYGVPVENDAIPSFFESPEVLLMLSLLGMANNPLYDIYTAGALRSPVFGFTLDELIAVKSAGDMPIFRCLAASAKGEGEAAANNMLREKCADAVSVITRWREAAAGTPSDEFVLMLYRETGLLSVVLSDANLAVGTEPPSVRTSNLYSFYEYAKKFESGAFRGVHRFLEYINDMIERGVTADVKRPQDGGAVKIMTIHQSKGLEFPVVFLSGCGSRRNRSDTSKSLIFDADTGVAMKIRPDPDRAATMDTLPRKSAAAAVEMRSDSEEMRILYVGMTRAKEMLYITAETRDDVKSLIDSAGMSAPFFSPHTVREKKTPLEWILTSCADADGEFPYEIICADAETDAGLQQAPAEATPDLRETATATDPERIKAARDKMKSAIEFEYPHSKTGKIPAKISVSRLTPDYFDEGDGDSETLSFDFPEDRPEAARAGTATHLFMQFCDFELAARDVGAEADRLVRLGYIRQEERELIRISEAEKFFRSRIYGELSRAELTLREKRFNVRFPASDFALDPETKRIYEKNEVLVQGVIDLMYVLDGQVVVVDYKTDRLTDYELSHREAAAAKLRERHSRQLKLYGHAAKALFGKAPAHLFVYSLALGDAVEIF